MVAAKHPPQGHGLSNKVSAQMEVMLAAKHPLGRDQRRPCIRRERHGSGKVSATKAERRRQTIHQDDPNDDTVGPTIAKTSDKHTHRHSQGAPTWTDDDAAWTTDSDDPRGATIEDHRDQGVKQKQWSYSDTSKEAHDAEGAIVVGNA